MRTLYSEFPDWDGAENDLIVLVPFYFAPWRNDTCQKYVWDDKERHPGTTLTVWVHYKRSRGPRIVMTGEKNGTFYTLIQGETWDEMREKANNIHVFLTGRDLDAALMAEEREKVPLGQLMHATALKMLEVMK